MSEEAILAFASSAFRSVWPLEVLILLRQEPIISWQLKALVRELRASPIAIDESLAALMKVQMVVLDAQGAYRFQPGSPETDKLARELSEIYTRKPRAVMRAIASAPNERIQTLADAFLLRKDKD